MAISRNPRLLTTPERLYLDHAATTPVLPEAGAAVADALAAWANPSSPHADGRRSRALLDVARRTIANSLDWRHDVIFTSGATEAIALAASRAKMPGRAYGATEHDAVGAAMGRARVLPVDANGIIDMAALGAALAVDPALIAIQHVNNETGVIQPIGEIAARVRAAGSLLLCDCAQSAGKLPLPDADFISISGHKFGAPPGCGALLVRDLSVLRATGGQERGYRRGTENLPGAAGMAAALATGAWTDALARIKQLRSQLEQAIVESGGAVIAGGSERSPLIGGYTMPGVASASQLVQLDLAGISVSAGSACSSGSLKPSRVLAAMGIPTEIASSVIRVSFGPRTGEGDVGRFVTEWRRIAGRAPARAA
ncbi:aminotransferase class V-fold PLP-dependent enzyme [Sphingomonas sp.]|uniref:cysteine desulfurase family protein n=1 Tax=Sphingomonas sp. TaxID=28214 RepID=UPI0025EC9801|nr:aminotransferase class V-fold PLP-dependent enzyme [Sphingomonas sp.]